MSEFHIEVVRIGEVTKHPNADSLSMTMVHGGYPVLFKTGDYSTGDLATYIPIDAIVPDTEVWSFLGSSRRIRAKRLRGVFSMGLLAAAPIGAAEGDDVQERLGITKYDPSEDAVSRGQNPGWINPDDEIARPAQHVPVYDLEGLRRHPGALIEGEQVVITEKIHGENMRLYRDLDGELWVGSRTKWKRIEANTAWSNWARANVGITDGITRGMCLYGELYGNTDLKYDGASLDRKLRVFDIYNAVCCAYLNHDHAVHLLEEYIVEFAGLERVPLLYRGPWSADLMSLADGASLIADHIREGFVVRPIVERMHGQHRCVFKHVGEGYLTRKEKAQ